MWRTDSFEKTLMLGKIESRRRRGWQRMRSLDGTNDSMDMSLSISGSWWWTGRPGVLQPLVSQRVGHDWATELNWRSKYLFSNHQNNFYYNLFVSISFNFCLIFKYKWTDLNYIWEDFLYETIKSMIFTKKIWLHEESFYNIGFTYSN